MKKTKFFLFYMQKGIGIRVANINFCIFSIFNPPYNHMIGRFFTFLCTDLPEIFVLGQLLFCELKFEICIIKINAGQLVAKMGENVNTIPILSI